MKNRIQRTVLAALFALMAFSAYAISFNLDSVAEWGRFPRFCVNTYRWGDKFFNGYDTTYVASTGYKFNAKVTTELWTDGYRFTLPNRKSILMASDPQVSVGAYLTYLAVSAGYDVNMNRVFGDATESRKRWRFGFNCMLFAAEVYYIRNDVGTTIRRFGDYHGRLRFDHLDNTTWGVDAYYFFNHKRYSEAATFNFSRIQRRSQGAFYTGFSIYTQKLDFNFRSLPPDMLMQLPPQWKDYHYRVNTHNYALRLGYGYNLVLPRGWVIGASESPIVGIRKGFVNSDIEKTSFSLYNRLKVSGVWNSHQLFFGLIMKMDVAIVSDKTTTYAGANFTTEAVFGYRFNLW